MRCLPSGGGSRNRVLPICHKAANIVFLQGRLRERRLYRPRTATENFPLGDRNDLRKTLIALGLLFAIALLIVCLPVVLPYVAISQRLQRRRLSRALCPGMRCSVRSRRSRSRSCGLRTIYAPDCATSHRAWRAATTCRNLALALSEMWRSIYICTINKPSETRSDRTGHLTTFFCRPLPPRNAPSWTKTQSF